MQNFALRDKDKGLLILPGGERRNLGNSTATVAKIPKSTPVMVYLHGCDGMTPHDPTQVASRMDLYVVAPDSLKREGRIADCDSGWGGTSRFPQAINYRMQEIRYALTQLQKYGIERVVLFGHSEGGKAAANWNTAEFRGIIITGWNCSTKDTYWNGTKIPVSVPVMNIVGQRDRYLVTNTNRSCARELSNHQTKVIINPDKTEHWFNNQHYPEIVQFIKDNTR
jgi:dienelactone hydrolase